MSPTPVLLRAAAVTMLAAALFPAQSRGQAPSFEVVGNFSPAGVSDDGNVVAGTWIEPGVGRGLVLARWTPAGGVRTAGFAPNSEHTSAHAVSGDGSTILAVDYNGANMLTWSQAAGIQYPPGTGGNPGGISRDALVIVGGHVGGAPFRWTSAGGVVDLPMPPGVQNARADAVSADGSIVAGTAYASPGAVPLPFRWTAAGGTVPLDGFDGAAAQGHSVAISADGSTVGGWGWLNGDAQAWRWTTSGGLEWAGHVAGERPAPWSLDTPAVYGLTGDGSVAVGRDTIGPGAAKAVAFYWERGEALRPLKDVLQSDYGMDLAGWDLHSAAGISPDGRFIVGSGAHPQFGDVAWRAVLPEPAGSALLTSVFAALALARRRSAPTVTQRKSL